MRVKIVPFSIFLFKNIHACWHSERNILLSGYINLFTELNVDNMTKLKHIVVSVDNYRWLKSLGQTSDSFNDVISELRQARENSSIKNLRGPDVPTPPAQAASSTTPPPTTYTGTTEADSLIDMAATNRARRSVATAATVGDVNSNG
jgi:hypothetical protein